MKITKYILKLSFAFCLTLFLINTVAAQTGEQKTTATVEQYQCLPCGQDCDNKAYSKPGKCPICHMQLVQKSAVTFKTISPEKICAYISQHPGVVLLDVRTKEEFEGKASPRFRHFKKRHQYSHTATEATYFRYRFFKRKRDHCILFSQPQKPTGKFSAYTKRI